MLAPQSPADVLPVETALRTLDDQLRIVWNPTAFLACPGSYDALGHAIPARYDGRWQVVRLRSPGDPDPALIYTVAHDGEGRKAYKPVGPWLVAFMQRWDAANRHFAEEMAKRHAENDRLEAAAKVSRYEAEILEAAERSVAPLSGREMFPGFSPTPA